MEINGKRIIIEGKLLRIAQLDPVQQEWFEDVENPEMLIDALQKSKTAPRYSDLLATSAGHRPNVSLSNGTGFDRGASN